METGKQTLQMLRAELESVRRKMDRAIVQLSDSDLTWKPTEESNSVLTLVLHITEYFSAVLRGIGAPVPETADHAKDPGRPWTVAALRSHLNDSVSALDQAMGNMDPTRFSESIDVEGRQMSLLTLLGRYGVRHAAEHMGQVLYIAKMRLGKAYRGVTSSAWGAGS